MRKLLVLGACTLLLLQSAWARPSRPPVVPTAGNNTSTPAKPMVANGKIVLLNSSTLTLESGGKRESYRVGKNSQIPEGLKDGAEAILTYTVTPQGKEVVRLAAKPSK